MTEASAVKPLPLYFVNAWVDSFCIGAFSLLCFAFIRYFHSGLRTDMVIYLGGTLVWFVNWPHFSATSYRLYQSKENIRQYYLTAFLIPIVVALGAIFSFVYPQVVAPAFVKIFLIWSPYHFSGQTVGITLIYARRAGLQLGKAARLALAGFVFGTFAYQSLAAETYEGHSSFYAISYPIFDIPNWIPKVAGVMMYGCALVFFLLMIQEMRSRRKFIPLIVFLPLVTQYVWFVHSTGLAAFQEFVPLFHSLQYLLIAWSMQLHSKAGQRAGERPLRFIFSTSAKWGLANFLGGAFLFALLPVAISKMGVEIGLSAGVILAAVQIHHFFVDGVIWKLKRKTVASPLTANISDLFAERVTQEAAGVVL